MTQPFDRPSPLTKLATETITQIFESASPVIILPIKQSGPQTPYRPRLDTDPWILGAVCKRWQNIVLSHGSLWASVIVECKKITQTEWGQWGLSQLRHCMNRSGSHPLHIRVVGDSYTEAVVIDVFDVVQAYSERWKSVGFIAPVSRGLFHRFDSLEGRLPMLEHLDFQQASIRFGYVGGAVTCRAFLSAPALTRMHISPFYGLHPFDDIPIPWAQISKVTFCRNDFQNGRDFYHILTRLSPSLTILTITQKLYIGIGRVWSPPQPIEMPKLRELRFLEDCSGMLNMLTCPALKELHIEAGEAVDIRRFLDESSCALTHIHLNHIVQQDQQDSSLMVLQNSSLTTLRSIFLGSVSVTDAALDLLIFDSRRLFPLFESLCLYSIFTRDDDGPSSLASRIDILRNIVRSRTRDMPSSVTESCSDASQSNRIENVAENGLQNCSFTFLFEGDGPETDEYWDTSAIDELRSFCIAQNTPVLLEILYTPAEDTNDSVENKNDTTNSNPTD